MSSRKLTLRSCVIFALIISIFTATFIFSQHITVDDSILSRPAKAIIAALRTQSRYDSRTFGLRVKMIRALGKKGNKIAKNQLLITLGEGRTRISRVNRMKLDFWKIRAESALALGKIGDKSATKAIVNTAIKDEDIQVRMCAIKALGMLKDKTAVPRMLDLLEKTAVDRVANELVKALGEIGDKRAFPLLLAVTQRNFSQYVRKNALLAIRKIKWD